jgi:MFS family permease
MLMPGLSLLYIPGSPAETQTADMKTKALLPIYMAAAIGPIGAVGILPLIPVLSKSWDVSVQWVTLAITIYLIPFVAFQVFSGSIAQVFNTRKTLLFGFSVYVAGAILSGFSFSMGTLIAARFIQGFGAAFISPIVMALVGEYAEERHLGRAMGILGITYTIGATMGPLISGVLEVYFGWPAFFFFLALLAGGTGVLFWFASEPGGPSAKGARSIFDALPLVKKSFSYRDVRFLCLAAFSLFLAYIGMLTFAADHIKINFQLPSDKVGLILSMTGFSGVLVSPIAGFLGDKFGRKYVAFAGAGIMVGAILAQEWIDYSYAAYILLFAVFGAGSSSSWISLNTIAVLIIPDLRKPVSSLYNSFKMCGYAAAPVVLSFFYIAYSVTGVRWACILFLLISSVCLSRVRSVS